MPLDKVEKAKRRFMADLREGKEPGAPRTDANRAALEEAKKEFAKEVEKGKKSIGRATARGEEKIVEATAEGQRQIADATERAIRTLKSLSTASSSNAHAWVEAELEVTSPGIAASGASGEAEGAAPEEVAAQTEAAEQLGGESKDEGKEQEQQPKEEEDRGQHTLCLAKAREERQSREEVPHAEEQAGTKRRRKSVPRVAVEVPSTLSTEESPCALARHVQPPAAELSSSTGIEPLDPKLQRLREITLGLKCLAGMGVQERCDQLHAFARYKLAQEEHDLLKGWQDGCLHISRLRCEVGRTWQDAQAEDKIALEDVKRQFAEAFRQEYEDAKSTAKRDIIRLQELALEVREQKQRAHEERVGRAYHEGHLQAVKLFKDHRSRIIHNRFINPWWVRQCEEHAGMCSQDTVHFHIEYGCGGERFCDDIHLVWHPKPTGPQEAFPQVLRTPTGEEVVERQIAELPA